MSESKPRRLITRRDFLTRAAIGAALLSALPVLSACSSQQRALPAPQEPSSASELTKATENATDPTKAPTPTKAVAASGAFKGAKIACLLLSGGQTADQLYAENMRDLEAATGIVGEYSTLPFEEMMDKEMALIAASSADVHVFVTHYAQIGRFYDAMVCHGRAVNKSSRSPGAPGRWSSSSAAKTRS